MAGEADPIDTFFESGGETMPEGLTAEPSVSEAPDDPPERVEAPKVEAQAEEKPVEQPKVETKPVEQPKTVPLPVLLETRRQLQELKAELQALKGGGKPAEQAPAETKPPEDPIERIEWLTRQLSELQGGIRQREAQTNEERAVQNLGRTHLQHEEAFRAKTPDYDAAADYARERLADFYRVAGYEEAEVGEMTAQASLMVVQKALAAGKDPAAAVYELASKFGYAKQAPKPAPKPAPAEKIEQIEKGLAAAKSLGNGGAAEADETPLEAMANLEGAAFDKAWEKKFGRRERTFYDA